MKRVGASHAIAIEAQQLTRVRKVLSDGSQRSSETNEFNNFIQQGHVNVSGALIHCHATLGEKKNVFLAGLGLTAEGPGPGQSDVQGGQGDRADFGFVSNQKVPIDRIQDKRRAEVALGPAELAEFDRVLEEVFVRYAEDFASGFIAESPEQLRQLHRYFSAIAGNGSFPETICNAPWVSTVVEADGTVRPCFFHPPLGNIQNRSLDAILNSEDAIAFRRQLDVRTDPICRKCVCTLYLRS